MDENTKQRIKLLSDVGRALGQISNEVSAETNYYYALISLQKFMEMIRSLDLDVETLEGMEFLFKYLKSKIEKRMKQSLS